MQPKINSVVWATENTIVKQDDLRSRLPTTSNDSFRFLFTGGNRVSLRVFEYKMIEIPQITSTGYIFFLKKNSS